MTQPQRDVFLLTGGDADAALTAGAGKLTCQTLSEDTTQPFVALDTFDGEIRDMGAVLVEVGGALWLIRSGGPMVEQGGTLAGRFVSDLEPGPLTAALDGVDTLRSLQPVGGGTVTATRMALMDGEGKTQLRLTVQTLQTALGTEPGAGLSLVSVQGLRGYRKAYARVTEALGAAALPAGGGKDLSARLCPDFVPHSAKPTVPLTPTDTAFHAACDLINAHIPVARATEAGVVADLDTEYLHDYRVALRKIRSVISLFKGVYAEPQTAELKTAFSDLMAPTGRLRDLDVYLLEKDLYFSLLPDALHPGLTAMFALFEAERAAAHKAMAKRLGSKRYRREMARLEALFADPAQLQTGPEANHAGCDYACGLIWKRYRKVCKIASGITAETDDEEVHELRIHCKKLRYLMEFFAPFFPKEDIKGLIKALKRLQDNLGLFNDYSVQQDSLNVFLDDHSTMPRDTYAKVAQSIGALIAVLHQRQTEERAKVMASFARFDSPAVQASFRTLFKDGEVT